MMSSFTKHQWSEDRHIKWKGKWVHPCRVIDELQDKIRQRRKADLQEFLTWLKDIDIGFETDELPEVIGMQIKKIERLLADILREGQKKKRRN